MNEKSYIKQILSIKEYKNTLHSFFEEEKIDRPKKKSRYFVDILQNAIQTNDLDSLIKIWKEYEILYFKFLDFDKQKTADIMKSDMFKAFLVECFKNKKTEKVNIFFQTMGTYMLTSRNEWADWFEFPLAKNPSEHKVFGIYFTRLWFDNFFLSMFNFFMQVVRSVMSYDSDLENYFSLDMRLENCINQITTKEPDMIKQKYNLTDSNAGKSQIISQVISNLHGSGRTLHDVSDLLCDFRLTRENKQIEYRRASKSNKPKGISLIIQNKTKSTSPNTFLRKKAVPFINVENVDAKDIIWKGEAKDTLTKIDEQSNQSSPNLADLDNSVSMIENSINSTVIGNIAPQASSEINKNSSADSFGIKQFSSKISQKIFKPKLSITTTAPKVTVFHEHFSMVTHVKCSRISNSYWASLDVGGTFKIWAINDPSCKSLHTLSFKHTIYSFDWVSQTPNMMLLGTKGGSVKMYDVTKNEIVKEMMIDLAFPRINIVQSFDSESKFVCESLDRSRSTSSNSALPHGVISLYDAESWSAIQTNLITLKSDFTVNCMYCSSNTIFAGCSNGSIKLIDIRVPENYNTNSLSIFEGDEVINVSSMCRSKWSRSNFDPNYLICVSSKSQLKIFDVRNFSKSIPKESSHLNDFVIPLSWAEKPYGGEQTIYFPRANLISAAYLNNTNTLFSAAKKGILVQKINGTTLLDSVYLNAGHNSPVICIDSYPYDLEDSDNVVVLSGTMEGTISTIRINSASNIF